MYHSCYLGTNQNSDLPNYAGYAIKNSQVNLLSCINACSSYQYAGIQYYTSGYQNLENKYIEIPLLK